MSGRIKIVSDDLPPLIAVLEEALKVWGMRGNALEPISSSRS
jgi:hypothetical protein